MQPNINDIRSKIVYINVKLASIAIYCTQSVIINVLIRTVLMILDIFCYSIYAFSIIHCNGWIYIIFIILATITIIKAHKYIELLYFMTLLAITFLIRQNLLIKLTVWDVCIAIIFAKFVLITANEIRIRKLLQYSVDNCIPTPAFTHIPTISESLITILRILAIVCHRRQLLKYLLAKHNIRYGNNENCAICRDDKNDVMVDLKCNHSFHFMCIDEIFKSSLANKCPLCRNEI